MRPGHHESGNHSLNTHGFGIRIRTERRITERSRDMCMCTQEPGTQAFHNLTILVLMLMAERRGELPYIYIYLYERVGLL